jgi:hypothetical protein
MAILLRRLPVFLSVLVLACPQAFCCCLWADQDAPAGAAPTCCAKLADQEHSDGTPDPSGAPCQPGLRCCGQSVSALPQQPLTHSHPAPSIDWSLALPCEPLDELAATAALEAHAFLPDSASPPLHVQLCVWRC